MTRSKRSTRLAVLVCVAAAGCATSTAGDTLRRFGSQLQTAGRDLGRAFRFEAERASSLRALPDGFRSDLSRTSSVSNALRGIPGELSRIDDAWQSLLGFWASEQRR